MSEDYGIKVSKAGQDVKTSTDANTLFTTKYSIPKAVNYEEFDMDSVGNPYNFAHDADYVPFVLAYSTANGDTNKVGLNYFNYNDVDSVQGWLSANTDDVYIQLAGTPDNKKVQIYVFVPEI